MNDESIRYCPRDDTPLNSGTFHDLPMHLCPECQGVLIEQRRMDSLLNAVSKELQRTIPRDAPLDEIPDKGPNVVCPVCEEIMENYGYMGLNFIIIDSCHACRVVWIDTAELGAMSVQFARTTRRIDMAQMKAESDRLESNRSLDAINRADAVGRLMLLSFVIGKAL